MTLLRDTHKKSFRIADGLSERRLYQCDSTVRQLVSDSRHLFASIDVGVDCLALSSSMQAQRLDITERVLTMAIVDARLCCLLRSGLVHILSGDERRCADVVTLPSSADESARLAAVDRRCLAAALDDCLYLYDLEALVMITRVDVQPSVERVLAGLCVFS